ncbi:MAG: DNA-3-methyladenine glycosylase [Flavobacteriales bacterium]
MRSAIHKLPIGFYQGTDVVDIARDLLGKVIVTNFNGNRTAGIITETEAYAGVTDKASHAYGGKRTSRNKPMYEAGGIAYVYLCYGIHHLFNVVTNVTGVPHAVLIRAIHPSEGLCTMKERRSSDTLTTAGPGTLTQALGIRTEHSGTDLSSGLIRLEDHSIAVKPSQVFVGPRIGIDYAGMDALLPYRFRIAPSHLL